MWNWKKFGSVWESAESLPLADRGFRYGMSVFASLTVESGRPLLLEAHLERLATLPIAPELIRRESSLKIVYTSLSPRRRRAACALTTRASMSLAAKRATATARRIS